MNRIAEELDGSRRLVMSYLLETNAWIHYLKNPRNRIREKLAALRPAEVVTCSIVRGELLHGAKKYGSRSRRISLVQTTLAPFVSLPFDDQDANAHAKLPHSLERAETVIGPYDLQIAAICTSRRDTALPQNLWVDSLVFRRESSRGAGLRSGLTNKALPRF